VQLSVIIVNYNVRAFLENALLSVQKAMFGVTGEVIVVDNASGDGSADMVRQKFPDVRLIANRQNVGFATANNQALRESKGEYCLLLNPDTIVQETTFRAMIGFFEQHPDAGLAGCRILNPDGSLQLACRRSFPSPWVAFTKISGLSSLFPSSALFGRYNLTYKSPDETYEVDAISGSFMFARRAVIESAGYLDENFFMYGEDLDWCYRVGKAGWKVYYVHATQIIHFKGESARRSSIDEVKLFYDAMRVFVRKHIRRGWTADLILRVGIALREAAAFFGRSIKPLRAVVADALVVDASIVAGEYCWFGKILHFPSSAIPIVLLVPPFVIVMALLWAGVYTRRKLSVTHSMGAVIVGYVILSALTFFFKQFAFSRMIVGISGIIAVIAVPGWRLAFRWFLRSPEHRQKSLFGRRTIIVGAGPSGQEILNKLRARISDGYDVVGFVDTSFRRMGELVAGVEILGSIDNIGKVIAEQRVSEVIFAAESLSYGDILSIIARSRNRTVNFRLVPTSMEVIIGKTHIDELNDIPLVEIDYNIDKPVNRLVKRLFDIACSLILLCTVYPFVAAGEAGTKFRRKIRLIPKVLAGTMSMVGPPDYAPLRLRNSAVPSYWGKIGLTGLPQINYHETISAEEFEKYNLYYAKNQSLVLDCEILVKSFLLLFHHR
jgi:O-antigen biosynthesis protein